MDFNYICPCGAEVDMDLNAIPGLPVGEIEDDHYYETTRFKCPQCGTIRRYTRVYKLTYESDYVEEDC